MNGPRFFPSGRRFGPYFSSRLDASVAPRPFSLLVASFFTTSSMGIAYQATISLAASAIVGSVMSGLHMRTSLPVANLQQQSHVALGHKRTYAVQEAMSAFTPNSDRESGFPHRVMSALRPKADMCGIAKNCPTRGRGLRCCLRSRQSE